MIEKGTIEIENNENSKPYLENQDYKNMISFLEKKRDPKII